VDAFTIIAYKLVDYLCYKVGAVNFVYLFISMSFGLFSMSVTRHDVLD